MDYSAQQPDIVISGGDEVVAVAEAPTYGYAREAEALIMMGRLEEAYEMLQAGITAYPEYPSGFQVLGDLYMRRGNLVAATFTYFEALRREPDNPLTLLKLGDVAKSAGNIPEARIYYLQAAQLESDSEAIATRMKEIGFFEVETPELEHDFLVTETAADLFRTQGYIDKARAIYLMLLKGAPGDQHLHDKLKLCG
jgi:tetratricopeptide (TPR) repeat protein